jgi:hypothetical protein
MRAERIGARVREHSLWMADEGPVAATHDDSREDLKGTTYELFILAISILSIVNLVLVSIFEFKSSYWWLVAMVDMALTLIFVFDFGYRLQTAPSKRSYLGRGGGVFDLLGCLPGLRIFRLFRIFRAVRIIRRLGRSGDLQNRSGLATPGWTGSTLGAAFAVTHR